MNWKYPFAQVIFDDDPSRKDPNLTAQDQMEEMSQAVIKALVDSDNKEYIGYFLPTAETRAKRAREESDEPDEPYDFKLIREYNWNRKDKTMSGFEENYFLIVRDDCVAYNELETRVRLIGRENSRKRLQALTNEEDPESMNEENEDEATKRNNKIFRMRKEAEGLLSG